MPSSVSDSETAAALARLKPFFRRAFVFSLLAGLLVLAPTLYMFEVYDRVVNSRSGITLGMLSVLVLVAIGVMEVLEWARSETLREAGVQLDAELAPRIFSVIHTAQLKKGQTLGTQPLSDLRTVREMLHSSAVAAALEAPVALVMLAFLFFIHPLLGVTALGAAIVQCGLSWLNERGTSMALMQANQSEMGARTYMEGTLRHGEVIAAMGMESDMRRRWMGLQRDTLSLQSRASDHAGLYQSLGKWLQTTVASALLGLGAWLLIRGEMPGGAGMLIVGSVLGARMLAPLVQLVAQWRSVVNARQSWKRLSERLAQLPEVRSGMPLPPPVGRLMVEGLVASAAAGGATVLRAVSFALQPGEAVAVIGPSASGKTTLARMLMGLWAPLAGSVRLDGVDVSVWDKSELGPYVGYVPQNVELMEGTLAENIVRFGDVDADALYAAAQAVGIHDWISGLPQGYDTPVGDEGVLLSGGQRQRVAIARALYGDPVFLVLDEPNANLDEAGHVALAQALGAAKARGATVVVMTHLPSVLAVADKVLVLAGGTQQALGPREEVLAALRSGRAVADDVPPAKRGLRHA